jgi:hypothetical protein
MFFNIACNPRQREVFPEDMGEAQGSKQQFQGDGHFMQECSLTPLGDGFLDSFHVLSILLKAMRESFGPLFIKVPTRFRSILFRSIRFRSNSFIRRPEEDEKRVSAYCGTEDALSMDS